MSEEKKTIKINPEMFKFPEKTRKKKIKDPSETKIRMKSLGGSHPMHAKTLKKNVMKMIRARQQDEYKNLFSEKEKVKNGEKQKEKNTDVSQFSNEFDKSLDYFESLAKTKPPMQSKPFHNHSLKQYPKTMPSSPTHPSASSFPQPMP